MDKFTITITSDKPISVKVTEAGSGAVKDGLLRLTEEIRNAGGGDNADKSKAISFENRRIATR